MSEPIHVETNSTLGIIYVMIDGDAKELTVEEAVLLADDLRKAVDRCLSGTMERRVEDDR